MIIMMALLGKSGHHHASGGCCKTRKYTPRTSYRNSALKFGIVAKPLNKGACPLAQSLFELGFPHFLCFLGLLQQPPEPCATKLEKNVTEREILAGEWAL